jgi:predicted Zn-dependent protease with MMP-like domain
MLEPDAQTLEALARRTVELLRESLPPELIQASESVALIVEPEPDPSAVEEGVAPDTLGLFSGDSHRVFPGDILYPPRIHIYWENLWHFSEGDIAGFIQEVRRTYLHELGHYLGLNENDLSERGLA